MRRSGGGDVANSRCRDEPSSEEEDGVWNMLLQKVLKDERCVQNGKLKRCATPQKRYQLVVDGIGGSETIVSWTA